MKDDQKPRQTNNSGSEWQNIASKKPPLLHYLKGVIGLPIVISFRDW